MPRTQNEIEYIKDSTGKEFILANSIATDDNKSLQDILNLLVTDHGLLCMISGTIVKQPNNENSIVVHTWSDIKTFFKNAFGMEPSNQHMLGVTFTNGDALANGAHLNGSSWVGESLYATFNEYTSNAIRINYAYFYYKGW